MICWIIVTKQKHIDKVNEDAWSVMGIIHIKSAPLENNHEDKVTKQGDYEDHLWNELQDNVGSLLEITRQIMKQEKESITGVVIDIHYIV